MPKTFCIQVFTKVIHVSIRVFIVSLDTMSLKKIPNFDENWHNVYKVTSITLGLKTRKIRPWERSFVGFETFQKQFLYF